MFLIRSKSIKMKVLFFLIVLICNTSTVKAILADTPAFHVLVLTERGGIHEGFVAGWFNWKADSLTEKYLSGYQVFLQLNYPPYMWSDSSKSAFIKYMEEGRGGWVGLHHASLLGEFDGYPMWDWYSQFMGGIRWKNYIARRAKGTVHVEDPKHPVMKGLPEKFDIPDDEWYTYDKDPRPNVHVLADVDENSYQPPSDIKMGDHPVIWTNEKIKSRNVYFQMGHHVNIFQSSEFKKMFGNAILWAAGVQN